MGSASSAPKKQVVDGCQMCKIGAIIQWQCLECNLFLCDRCKYTDHDKFGAQHNILSENKSSSTLRQAPVPINSSSGSTQQAQVPIGCQMCNKEARIQWRCEDCKLSICDHCKYFTHKEFGALHNINNIKGDKASGEESNNGTHDNNKSKENMDSKIKSTETDIKYEDKQLNIKFKVVKHYKVDTRNIHLMAVSPDGSLWIGDIFSKKILHMILSSDSVTVLSSFDMQPFSLAISPSGSTLVKLKGESNIKIINEKTRQFITTRFTLHPRILPHVIHVTREKNMVLGGFKGNKGVVVEMDQNGKELMRYENDKDKSMVTYPRCIATTRNGNIFIADGKYSNKKGRVVRIRPGDRDIVFYEGHSDINSDEKPFDPVSILVTPRDNVLFLDFNTNYLHILNNEGDFITYYNMTDIRVKRPNSMAFTPSGNIYFGGVSSVRSPPDYQATLYESEFSGI